MAESRLPPLLALLRPRQWYKNLLVLVPILFAGHVGDAALWPAVGATFLAFCALSGAVYASNDVVDAARDRTHPRKMHRPVASGVVSPTVAILLALVLAAAGLAALAWVNALTFAMGVAYLLLQCAYNGALKRLLLWDAIAVAFGFVLRALAGTTALELGPPTEWLIVCTFLFALYLALAKRRAELLHAEPGTAQTHRPALAAYNPAFVDQTMQTSATLLLAAYTMYTFFGPDKWLMFTLPFAFYGVFRHSWLVQQGRVADEAEAMWRDRALQVNTALWIATLLIVQAGAPQEFFAWLGAMP
ncbi:MAG: UbiA prenyltransferase family protein [Candidatus Thermoplasmatota archaeon]